MGATKRAWTRELVALAAVASTVAAMGAASAGVSAGREGRLVGAASGNLPERFGPNAGDPVKFEIDARGVPGATTGTFKVFHGKGTSGEVLGKFEGDITCLMAAGEVAIATGVITDGYVNAPGIDRDATGKKVSFTVHDDGRSDRMYWRWGFFGEPINDCQGVAPIFQPSRGGFRVHE